MRHLYLFLIIIVFPILSFASMVKNDPFEQIQPDGTKLNLFVSGNEFNHRVHDDKGYTILLHPETGYAVYAIPDGKGIKASSYRVGSIDPSTLGIEPNLNIAPEEIEQKVRIARENGYHRDSRNNTTGQWNNLVVFIRFQNQVEFGHTRSRITYNTFFNGTGANDVSVHKFFAEESGNQLSVNSFMYPNSANDWIVSLQDNNIRSYYEPYNAATNLQGYHNQAEQWSRLNAMLTRSISLLEASNQVPEDLDLDADNDGNVDNVSFIVEGSRGGWGDCLWDWTSGLAANTAILNGEWVRTYNTTYDNDVWVGRQCHEMSHSIGFPDLYHYLDNHVGPVDAWDLMESDSQPPEHTLVYMKYKYGHWCSDPTTIAAEGTYTLNPVSTSPFSAYKIASTDATQPYYVEYRKKEGTFESSIYGSGLIVYKINTAYEGNADGPPDGVYVYRPNGSTVVQGNPDLAFYSAEAGRTAIHSYTNPQPLLANNTDGGLKITDIGSAGSTISFKKWNTLPKIWAGTISTDWNTAGNWKNGIPTASDNVEIPTGCARNPLINTVSALCNNLHIESGTVLTVGSYNLGVSGNMTVTGALIVTGAIDVSILGSVYWESGSTANIANANAEMFVHGDMEFLSGSNVQIANGYIEFTGTGTSYLKVYANSALCNLRSNKTAPDFVGISYSSTNDLTINGSFFNYAGKIFKNYYTGIVHIKGSFNNYAGGLFYAYYGAVSFEGTSLRQITNNSADGCYFNSLRVVMATGQVLSLNTPIDVNGYVYILTGVLQSNNYEIKVGGSWTNNVGTTGFVEGTGQVVFDGTDDQTCSSEDFYTLVLNKASGEMVIPITAQTECNFFDWNAGAYRVDGGLFLVNELVDNGIYGTITLNSGNIEYNQEVAAGQYVDLHGNITIHDGNFTINGGVGPCDFPYQTASSITMNGGILDFTGVGIRVRSEWALTENITSGTIRTAYGFENTRTDFTPTGGTIELYGTADCSLITVAGSNFYNLTIAKGARGNTVSDSKANFITNKNGRREPLTRTNGVTCPSALDINGAFTLSGGIFTAPATMQVAGNWVNTAGAAYFVEGVGSVEFNGPSHQYCNNSETFYTLLINKAAAFRINNANAVVTCTNYTWTAGAVDVLSGTFTANDLTQSGIYGSFYANPGATINLYQDAANYPDLNGFLYNYGGTINIYGGSLDCYWAYAAAAGITMTSGVIDFKNKGIIINPSIYALTLNVTGGTIRTVGSFAASRNAVNINGGVLELYGAGNMSVALGTSSNLGSLYINKTITREQDSRSSRQLTQVRTHDGYQNNDQRFEGVIANSNLTLMGYLNVYRGLFDVNGKTIQTSDDVTVYSTLKMLSSGSIVSGDDFAWFSGSTSQINAGSISCRGNWSFYNGSTAQLSGCTTTLNPDYDITLTTNSSNSWFGNLILNGNGGGEGSAINLDYITADSLLVKGLLTIYADNHLYLNEHPARVDNAVTVYEAGSITVGDGCSILMKSALDLQGTLDIGPGTVVVKGVYTSYDTSALFINWGVFTNTVAWARTDNSNPEDNTRSTVELKGAIHLDGGVLEITNNTVVMRANADRYFANCTLRVGAGFTASELNAFHPISCTVVLIGDNNPTLNVTNGNYLCELTINKGSAYRAYLQNDLLLLGSMSLQVGGLIANNHDVTLGGYWTNNIGTGGFTPGTGTVTFNGSSDATGVYSSETFYNLTLNNTSAGWDNFSIANGKTVTVNHDVIVTDGTINMQTNSALVTANDISIASGAGINCQNGANVSISIGRNWTDSNAAYSNSAGLYPGTATLTFNGSGVQTVTHTSTYLDVCNLVVNKSTGTEIHFSKAVRVWGACSITSGVWVDMVTNLTHEFRGNLTIGVNGVWFASNANTIAFKGTADQVFTNSGSSSIRSLTVDKQGSLAFGSNILGLNGGTVLVNAGTLDLNNYFYRTTGSVTVNITGKIAIDGDGSLELANTQALTVNSGGKLELLGTSGHLAKLTHQSGYYACNIESGATISAEYALFEYMNATGIYVKNGALVDATHTFHNSTFRLGAASGTLLTINNNQTLNISGLVFPTNNWSGSFNVSKTLNQGTINFSGFSGGFSGSGYESDTFGRVNWQTGLPDLRIVSYTADYSNRYVCEPVNYSITVINDSDFNTANPVTIDLYFNLASIPATGTAGDRTYSLAGLGAHAQTTYTFPASSSTVAGTWHTYFRMDTNNTISESNESNNAAGYITTTWNALPTVQAPVITYHRTTNNIQLNWSYPTSVYQYKIYRSLNATGPFTTLAGTSPVNSFSEILPGVKCFYKVVAEKNWP